MVAGYEKFWAALLGGGMAAAVTILVQWGMSGTGAFDAPGPEEIRSAVAGVVSTVFAAFGAYLATNTDPSKTATVISPAEEL